MMLTAACRASKWTRFTKPGEIGQAVNQNVLLVSQAAKVHVAVVKERGPAFPSGMLGGGKNMQPYLTAEF